MRNTNLKTKSSKALGFSEKSEVENLFLDCIDETKKDLLKKKNKLQSETPLIEQVVLNKEGLIGVFEEMFGSGGYVGSAI